MHYIVLDHVERIATADVLPVLLRLRELTGAALGLVLISQVAWGLNVFEYDTLPCPKPHQLCFPGYRMQDLLKVRPVPLLLVNDIHFHPGAQTRWSALQMVKWTIVMACKGTSPYNCMVSQPGYQCGVKRYSDVASAVVTDTGAVPAGGRRPAPVQAVPVHLHRPHVRTLLQPHRGPAGAVFGVAFLPSCLLMSIGHNHPVNQVNQNPPSCPPRVEVHACSCAS